MLAAAIDPDLARDLLEQELSQPVYLRAQPSAIDQFADAIRQWIVDFLSGVGVPNAPSVAVAIISIVILLLVAAFAVLGIPRITSRRTMGAKIFDNDDLTRSAEEFRARARQAADAQDYSLAVTEHFRAIVRALDERTVVHQHPGMTAQEFIRQASRAFTPMKSSLADAAQLFDYVRYSEYEATSSDYVTITSLDSALMSSRPDLAPDSSQIEAGA